MPKPSALPFCPDGPFLVRDALDAGASRNRLARTDLTAPIHGIRTLASQPVRLVEAVAAVLRPDQFFSHVTAAALWGAPVIDDDPDVVHVSVLGDGPVMRRPEVVSHRARVPTEYVAEHHGVRLSTPARCWYECAGLLPWEDLVVLGDHFVGQPGLATVDDLRQAVPARGHRARDARTALEYIRVGSESPMETRLRLRVVGAGFPEPVLNVDVHAADGSFLGRVDMAWPEYRIALEYDGDHHRERETFRHDQRRGNGFAVNGWIVVHATAVDAGRPAVLFERLRQGFEQRRLERANARRDQVAGFAVR
jgi:hypothetical protein